MSEDNVDEAVKQAKEDAKKRGWEGDAHRILYGSTTVEEAIERMIRHYMSPAKKRYYKT